MARKEAASKLTLKVITGVSADGKNLYKNARSQGLRLCSRMRMRSRSDAGSRICRSTGSIR